MLALLSNWRIALAAVGVVAIIGLGWALKHEVAANGALATVAATAQQIADTNAAAALQIKADAARDMSAVTAQLDAERARADRIVTITKVIHDAPKDACEDSIARPGSAGDAAYLSLFNAGSDPANPSGAGAGAGTAH
jgi:hypothetical protein